jgi:TonB family protein
MAQALLETLFFYHPVVHWISRDVRNEREICCDALVLRRVASEPRDYARTLAALEELRQPPAQLALAASGGVLLERVRRIVGMPMPAARTSRGLRLGAVLGGISLAAALALQVQSPAILSVDGLSLRVDHPTRTLSRPFGEIAISELVRLAPVLQLQKIEPQPDEVVAAAPARVQPADVASAPAKVVPAEAPLLAQALPAQTPDTQISEQRGSTGTKVDAPAALVAAATAAPPVVAPSAEVTQPHSAPVATRTTAPEYPYSASVNRRERVELAFAIDAKGGVQDIQVVSAPSDAVFARAARRALEHWRFDPATASSPSTRYHQAFVFAPPVTGGEAGGCIRRTGSQLCQRNGESEVEGENARSGGNTLAAAQ